MAKALPKAFAKALPRPWPKLANPYSQGSGQDLSQGLGRGWKDSSKALFCKEIVPLVFAVMSLQDCCDEFLDFCTKHRALLRPLRKAFQGCARMHSLEALGTTKRIKTNCYLQCEVLRCFNASHLIFVSSFLQAFEGHFSALEAIDLSISSA